MPSPIDNLQTNLANNLVKIEELGVNEQQMEQIEEVYESVYQILHSLRKD